MECIKQRYKKCIEYWDMIFKEEAAIKISKKEMEHKELEEAVSWITQHADTVLDFGCGNGSVLCSCALYGTTFHIGIDLSKEAITKANQRSKKMDIGCYQFLCGSIEMLNQIKNISVDSVILFNIVDNLYPKDAKKLLSEVDRVLKRGGKVLIKLNPYLTKEQIEEWNIKSIEEHVLDDGLILWNQTTKEWETLLEQYFKIVQQKEIYYEKYDQYNRLFFLEKN